MLGSSINIVAGPSLILVVVVGLIAAIINSGKKKGSSTSSGPTRSTATAPSATPAKSAQLLSTLERPCPFCAETIKAEAILCRFCGREVERFVPPPPKPLVGKNMPIAEDRWLSDTLGRNDERLWNGTKWTEFVRNVGQNTRDPIQGSPTLEPPMEFVEEPDE